MTKRGALKFFDPPSDRYRASGKESLRVTRIKATILRILDQVNGPDTPPPSVPLDRELYRLWGCP